MAKRWLKWCDFLLVGISFLAIYYYQKETFTLSKSYWNLMLSYYGFWLIINYVDKKYQRLNKVNIWGAISLAGTTCLYLLFLISFMTVLFQLSSFSRKLVISSCFTLFVGESILFSLYSYKYGMNYDKNRVFQEKVHYSSRIAWKRLLVDAILLFLSFIIINKIQEGRISFSNDYLLIFYVVTGLWFLTAIVTCKFEKNGYNKTIWNYSSPFIKSWILILFGLTLSIFLLKSYQLSRFEIFGTLFLFGTLEFIVFTLIFILYRNNHDKIEPYSKPNNPVLGESLELTERHLQGNNEIYSTLNYLIQVNKKDLYNFIVKVIEIENLQAGSVVMLDTRSSFNILQHKSNSIFLFLNLHKLNDFRWLNQYLIQVHELTINGGYIVGNLETIEQYKKRFFSKMPLYLAQLLYIPNFIFYRAFPKLPILKKIYFFLTDGKNRALSKAEAFGRLHFCGFTVVAEQEINNHLWFIARKVKTISTDQHPSYSLLIRLARVGLNGNIIYVYKTRTMYPYSEYLQEYIYNHNLLDNKGKIKDDFRITEWGKIFRKLWLDEMPQLINWLRGELNIVGVRALSQHYFSLYPEDVQKLRIKFKPGLIPPYYADMPKTFEEIVESERKYLLLKEEKPFLTDVIYFYKALYNIIFKHARSK